MGSKKGRIILIIGVIALLIGVSFIKFKNIKPNRKSSIVLGLTSSEQESFQKELSGALKQFSYIKKGDSFFNAGKYDDAIEEYQVAFSMAKSSGSKGEALRSLANLYEKKKDYKKALVYVTIESDKYIADWAKPPLIERVNYLKHACNGEYDLAIEHAKRAVDADIRVHNSELTKEDYNNRLNDLLAAKDYILSLKKHE